MKRHHPHLIIGVAKRWTNPVIIPFYGLAVLCSVAQILHVSILRGSAVTVMIRTTPVWYLIFFIQLVEDPVAALSSCDDIFIGELQPHNERNYKQFLTLGMILSTMGNALMTFPSTFTPGVCMYGSAHVMYIAGLKNRHIKSRLAWLVYPFTIGGVLSIAIWTRSLSMSAIIFTYYSMLTTMLFYALSSFESYWSYPTLLALIGAVSFVFSDGLIADDRWILQIPFRNIIVWSTYFFAQLNLALSV